MGRLSKKKIIVMAWKYLTIERKKKKGKAELNHDFMGVGARKRGANGVHIRRSWRNAVRQNAHHSQVLKKNNSSSLI